MPIRKQEKRKLKGIYLKRKFMSPLMHLLKYGFKNEDEYDNEIRNEFLKRNNDRLVNKLSIIWEGTRKLRKEMGKSCTQEMIEFYEKEIKEWDL